MRILALADIHIGSIKDNGYVYQTICDIFEKELIESKTDLVVFCGDVFERLFKVNEEYVTTAIESIQYLHSIAKKKNIKVRFIYGTESHEVSQYKLFKPFLDDKSVDFKIYTTVTEETIGGKQCLFIPEEYVESKFDHYNDTLYNDAKQYDYIFGHGVIIEGMTMVKPQDDEKKSNEKFVPIFKTSELSSKCKQCLFGHYHIAWDADNVHYIGSMFRTKFGEETPKRYAVLEDENFIPVTNDKAYEYKSYHIESNSDAFTSTDSFISYIQKIKDENADIFNGTKQGKIRLVIDTVVDGENLQSIKDTVKNILGDTRQFSYMMSRTKTDDSDEAEKQMTVEYDYIMDSNIPIEEKIFRYTTKMFPDLNFTLDEIIDDIFNALHY